MRVAVYNAHWPTLGGGEAYAGGLAEVLAEDHDVDLLCETSFCPEAVEQRFGLDLSGTSARVLGPVGDEDFRALGSEYDLLVNCSFTSRRPCGSPAGMFVVLFPEGDGAGRSPAAAAAHRMAGGFAREGVGVRLVRGFHDREQDGARSWWWTGAEAELAVSAPEGRPVTVSLDLSAEARPPGPSEVEVVVDGHPVRTEALPARGAIRIGVAVPGRGTRSPVPVVLRTTPFVPAEAFGGSDRRHLGLQVLALRVHRRRLPRLLKAAVPALADPLEDLSFLRTYHTLVAISPYTRHWVRRYWRRDPVVVPPGVAPRRAGAKERIVLAVGRFFDPGSGHCKKQVEMVEAFRRLRAGGALEGWELHLAGGCDHGGRDYLARVRERAAGLPVLVHADAPAGDLDDLYARASVYWHAAGLGEDRSAHPGRFEHFGISVVEAMAAGVVPVVLDAGGPADIVADGIHGRHFSTLEGLVATTAELAADPALLRALSRAARIRAGHFGPDRFAAGIRRAVTSCTR